jgi:hypothetical protein
MAARDDAPGGAAGAIAGMSGLDTSPRLDDPDGLFEALVDAHRGLDAAASRRLDARIILLLANHIGRVSVVREAIAAARAVGGPIAEPEPPT